MAKLKEGFDDTPVFSGGARQHAPRRAKLPHVDMRPLVDSGIALGIREAP